MAQAIRIIRGSIKSAGAMHLPGQVVVLSDADLERLVANPTPTLVFELVEDVTEGSQKAEKASAKRQPVTSDDDVTKPLGEMVVCGSAAGSTEEDEVAHVPATEVSSAPAAPAAGGISLPSVDEKVAAGLAAIGIDSIEKLKSATAEQLMTVKGIGKARAEAILSEAAGA